jgi:RES domain-containing protein
MTVYRLSACKYKNDLSGKGAELSGGRWNNKGTPMVYTSDSRALCTAEIAVRTPLGITPVDYCILTIEFPDNASIKNVDIHTLPEGWRLYPPPAATRMIGDKFILEGRHLIMKVPSAVVPGDYNYLINPRHKDFGKVKIVNAESFVFDERLFN